jgi:hypothetical protein
MLAKLLNGAMEFIDHALKVEWSRFRVARTCPYEDIKCLYGKRRG